jgi:CAAX prenyl protease-like protein
MLAVQRELKDAILYAAPFVTWIALQMLLPATAVGYAVRTAATTAVALACLKVLSAPKGPVPAPLKTAIVGLIGGLIVCALWIAPEYSSWYRTWLELPIGEPPPAPAPSPYEPSVCGWPLTLVKLVGRAFVLAPVEEVFFRSFLYRRLQARDFRAVPLSRLDLSAFLWTVFLFTLEHDRPVVAALAGAAYGLLAVRSGLGAAIAAHVVTNLALGLHVIFRGEWWFW